MRGAGAVREPGAMNALERVLSRLPDARPVAGTSQKAWKARCPAHDDANPSLSVSQGDGGGALIHCYAGCKPEAVAEALGLTMADLMPSGDNRRTDAPTKRGHSTFPTTFPTCRERPPEKASAPVEKAECPLFSTAEEAVAELERRMGPASRTWTYHDDYEDPVGLILRWDKPAPADGGKPGKDIRPVSRTREGWTLGGMATPRPLYRLVELRKRAGERVYVAEGEKAADAAGTLGLLATTSPHGASSAGKADWRPLAGRDVAILPDHDEAGRRYAQDVARILLALEPPATVRIVELPDLGPGEDIDNWLEHRDAAEPDTLRAQVESLVDATAVCRSDTRGVSSDTRGVSSVKCQVSSDTGEKPGSEPVSSDFKLETSNLKLPPAGSEPVPSDFKLETSNLKLPPAGSETVSSDFKLETSNLKLPPAGSEPVSSDFKLETSNLKLPPPCVEPRVAGPILTCVQDIEELAVRWLWPQRVALGRITMLVGRPGEGKSFLTTDMAARVTRGLPWPDGSACPAGSVLLISAEDDPRDTIRPRLRAHGADLSRVHLLSMVRRTDADGRPYEAMFTLADVEALRTAMAEHPDCRLVVVDPIGSFLGGGTDAHRDNDVRSILVPVSLLAERCDAAVLVVAHRRKSPGANADDMALGSRAFTGVARAVWHLTRDPDNKSRRLLLSGKNNLAAEGRGLAFTIGAEPGGLPTIAWEHDAIDMNADDAIRRESNESCEDRTTAVDKAGRWLENLLAEGPVPSTEVLTRGEAHGLSKRTLERAKESLSIRAFRKESDGRVVWYWGFSDSPADPHRQAAQADELLPDGAAT